MNIFSPHFIRQLFIILGLSTLALTTAWSQSDAYNDAFTAYQNQDFDTSQEIWGILADEGDVNAQYALAVMHFRNEASASSSEIAYKWFSEAAKQGHSTAMFNLGVALWEGIGVEKNEEQALYWWEKAAESGDSGAQFNLGLAHYFEESEESNILLAAKWLLAAAKQNHPDAKRIIRVLANENKELELDLSDIPDTGSITNITETDSDQTLAELNIANVAVSSDDTTQESAQQPTQAVTEGSQEIVEIDSNTEETIVNWMTYNRTTDLFISNRSDSIIIGQLPPNTPIKILDKQDNWGKVTRIDGLRLWIYKSFIDINDQFGTVNATSVRVRPKPTTDDSISPSLGYYENGAVLRVLNVREEWVEVIGPNTLGGWVPLDNLIEPQ